MSTNKDNITKIEHGLNAKQYTLNALRECEVVQSFKKSKDVSKNSVEKATYDLDVELNNHKNVLLLISSTHSLRDDRLDSANTRMKRAKKILSEQDQKCIGIVTSNCDNERNPGDDHKFFNGYNFGDREEIGLDILVKTDDLPEVLQTMNNVEDKDDVDAMKKAALECIKKKNY